MKIVDLKYDEINEHFKELLGDNFNQDLLDAVYELLPQISAYKEEDKVFGFKIALGYNFKSKIDVETSCFFEIKRFSLTGDGDFKAIQGLLKEAVIFCSKNADLYIDQISDTEIAFGVFFTDYKHTGLLERKILLQKTVILEGFINEGVRVLYGDDEKNVFIRLSISKNFDSHKYLTGSFHWSDECRYWDGIFKKVKQNVHGTICLIVEPSWQADDDNFVGGKVTEFEGVSLKYTKSENAQDLLKQQYCIEMFLSMLDYDGVTILDTEGNVRSYHNIVEIDTGNKVSGGARHQAFDSLKKTQDWESRRYVGIYFQSQEGETEFYSFEYERSQDFFRSEIMNFGADNPQLLEVKSYFENRYDIVVADCKLFDNDSFFAIVNDLEKAHFGWDNFSNEIAPSQTLFNFLQSYWAQTKAVLKDHPGLTRKLINALIVSFVGNEYGNSDGAAPYVEGSLRKIDSDLWNCYFDNKDFLYEPLLRALHSPSKNQRLRWDKLITVWKSLGLSIPKDVDLDVFWWRYRAFNHLDDIYRRERPPKNINE